MNIIHVINRCGIANGAAKLLLDIIPYQKKCGHQVDILTLVDISPSYKDNFINLGCKYISVLPQGYSMMNPLLLIKVAKIIRTYDIVHAHLYPSFYWTALSKVLFDINCKFVFTEHASQNNRRKCWIRPIEKYIYKQYDAIIAISKAVKSNLENHLCGNYNISIIENGINLYNYNDATLISRVTLGIPKDVILLIQIAGFRPEKDQMTVLKTMRILPSKYHILFVGNGALMEYHIKMAKELDIINRCHFIGVRNDVPSLLNISDIVIMSSYFEGFGLSALEGMAAHKPVIASNVPGLAEVVYNAGLLFEQGSAEQLAHHVLSLNNTQYYIDVSNKCFERALLYDISKTAQKYETIYQNLYNK